MAWADLRILCRKPTHTYRVHTHLPCAHTHMHTHTCSCHTSTQPPLKKKKNPFAFLDKVLFFHKLFLSDRPPAVPSNPCGPSRGHLCLPLGLSRQRLRAHVKFRVDFRRILWCPDYHSVLMNWIRGPLTDNAWSPLCLSDIEQL